MIIKKFKFDIKKIISVFGALAILVASIPLGAFSISADASTTGNLIDFEASNASAIVEGNDAFSIAGIDNPDKYYFYAKNNTSDTLTLTFDDIQLETGKKYTLDMDIYTLRMSEDSDNKLLGFKVYGANDTSVEADVTNADILEENWANYHTEFTAKDTENKLDFSIFTIGKVFIDNFVLIDENGNETAIDFAAACEATELKDHFSAATLYDIANEEPDIIDGYLKAAVTENSNITYNEGVDIPMNLSEPLNEGRYTMSIDLKFTALGSNRISFCTSIAGNNVSAIQHFLDAEDITLNKYYTYTYDFNLTSDYSWFRLHVFQGCTAYIDNIVLMDAAGQEVVKFDFDETVSFNGSAFEQKGIAKSQAAMAYSLRNVAETAAEENYAILIDNTEGTGYGKLYLHDVGMTNPNLPAGDYTIEFDFYTLQADSTDLPLQISKSDWSGNALGQKWINVSSTIGEWNTVSMDVTTTGVTGYPWFYVGAGLKGYMDNFKMISKSTGEVCLNLEFTAGDLGKTSQGINTVVALSTDSDEEDTPTVSDDYAILIDNSAGTGYGKLYLHDVGMTNPNIPAGDYTIEFDFYTLQADSTDLPLQISKSDWSGNALGQKWINVSSTVGEWNTISMDVTTTGVTGYPWFYVGAGLKGYMDNFKIISKSTGEVCLNLELTADDLGKTSQGINTVVALPSEEESEEPENPEPTADYMLLIDTTALDNNSVKDFWFNTLGMANHNNALTSGKNYTVTFDVYPMQMPDGNNLFHYRTSSGYTESRAGWWGSDLEVGKWQTTSNTFNVSDASKSGNHILYVYGGFKGYIDNLRLVDENGDDVEATFTDFNGLTVPTNYAYYLTITDEAPKQETLSDDYAILIDNSAGAGYGQLYLHDVGMTNPNLPAEDYTIEFDFYALQADSTDLPLQISKSDWSGNALGQTWINVPSTLGEWNTISVDVTTTGVTGYPWFYVGAGLKGYMDNFRIISKSTGEVCLNLEFTADDLGKTSKEINTVVALPQDVADAKNSGGSDDSEDILTSGMNIAVLRGRAGKNGASIKLGGANSPLTLKSNTSYKLSFRYYQANPTDSGILNLFGIDAGFGNDIAYFKKNNSTGWTTGTVLFTTGDVTNASANWLEIILNANAWVYFDDFKLVEQAADNNKEIKIVDFEQKDDSIYPDVTIEDCTFGQTTDFSGASNGSNGYFCANNATEYTNDTNNSNRGYDFSGIKLKSNTTYRVSIDYYVSKPFEDYAFAFGYNAKNLGIDSSEASWQLWVSNKAVVGWDTVSFTVTTGEVVPNASYIKLAFYDVSNSANPRVIYFDNLTFTELYKIDTTVNDSALGTATKTITVEGGDNAKVVAHPYEGATFEGWYEYGDLVSKESTYVINNIDDNHKLVAHFSGEAQKPTRIVQSFEDYDVGEVEFKYYNIVEDSSIALDGNKSLHVSAEKIEEDIDSSIFFPIVSSVEAQLKDDYSYDVYVWIKPVNTAQSSTYFQIVNSVTRDLSDMLYYGELTASGVQKNIKPSADTAIEVTEDGWCKYLIGTATKKLATKDGFGLQISKFHAGRQEGASIDEMYIDCIEFVERTPDFENMKYTEKLFSEISNSDFEDEITSENWAPLTDGLSVEKVTDKEYDWQGDYTLKFDAAKSNGTEYVRVIPIAKSGKNYTFAAWTKLSAGSDITVGLYKNGSYEPFANVVNGEDGTLGLIDDGKWNRVSFTFNSGDSENAYLVIKGTKGTLQLDMVEMFIALRGYTEDPNEYGSSETVLQMVDPIAYPDAVKTVTTYVEKDVVENVVIDTTDSDDTDDTDDETEESGQKTKKRRVVKKRMLNNNTSVWVWVGIGAGALVLVATTVAFIILFKKRKETKKEGK